MNQFTNTNFNGLSILEAKGRGLSNKILIFLPGIGAYKENYISHVINFIPFYRKLFIIDLPEQGSKGKWRIGTTADNLKEFLVHISNECESIDLGGHSAGALASIACILNYDSTIEKEIIDCYNGTNFKAAALNTFLKDSNFGKPTVVFKKLKNIFLYAPPDTFDIVFKRSHSQMLGRLKEHTVKRILDIFLNAPMKIMGLLTLHNKVTFKFTSQDKPQFFALVVKDYQDFFHYVNHYPTIFELLPHLENDLQKRIQKALKGKRILIQYGSFDWLIKPFGKRKKSITESFSYLPNTTIHKIKFCGHILSKRFNPDVNMNSQMVAHKEIIMNSIHFINR